MRFRKSGMRRPARLWLKAAMGLPLTLAVSQTYAQAEAQPAAQTQPQGLRITPSVSLSETFSDNVNLRSGAKTESDWITMVSPSLRLSALGRQVRGNLQMTFNSALYANDGTRNTDFLTLQGDGTIEAWEKRAFIDIRASSTRQLISAGGIRPADQVTGLGNQADVRNFSASPYVVGHFAGTGTAELRYTTNLTESSSNVLMRTVRQAWSASASDPHLTGRLGWAVNVTDTETNTNNLRDVKQQIVRLTGMFQLDPTLMLRLIVGSESNNLMTFDSRRQSLTGAGFDWTPSLVTKVSGTWEDRFFGPGYQIAAEHRKARSAYRLSFSKDVTSTSQSLVAGITYYDLLMQLFASSYPDPTIRDQAVRNYIADNTPGAGNAIVGSQAVLSNGLFLDRRAQFGMTLSGVRNTVTLTTYYSKRESLMDQSFAFSGDMSSGTQVMDTGVVAALSHQLTPQTTGTMQLAGTRSRAESNARVATEFNTRTRLITTGISTKFTPKLNGAVMYRNNQSSGSRDYSENAVIGSLSLQF